MIPTIFARLLFLRSTAGRMVILLSLLFSFMPMISAQKTSQVKETHTIMSIDDLLHHYTMRGELDKCDAIRFFQRNMRRFRVGGKIISYDTAIDSFRHRVDSVYFHLIKGTTDIAQESTPLHDSIAHTIEHLSIEVQQHHFQSPEVLAEEINDSAALDAHFIQRQIEHCFRWRNTPRLSRLSQDEFFEYILPYRAIGEYPLLVGADTLYSMFSKYLNRGEICNDTTIVERYNRAIYWLRRGHGRYPYNTTIGYPDLFFYGTHDCIDMAEYCAQILRSCGVPAVVETNIAYRIWNTRHYTVAILGQDGKWRPFSPEYSTPAQSATIYRPCLNIHRLSFCVKPHVPALLANGSEPIPMELADSCFEDVTSQYLPTTTLTLPISSEIPPTRKLAYLASFRAGSGLVAVTWGVRTNRGFIFHNVVKDNIYFPVWCDDNSHLLPMGHPFTIYTDTTCPQGYRIVELPHETHRKVATTLHRKYPRKPHLLEQARHTIGTVVLGCDEATFRNADTLATITTTPDTRWTDLPLTIHHPYRFYRVMAPTTDPHLHLSEIQFLTAASHEYNNTTLPSLLSNRLEEQTDSSIWRRLLDEPIEKCKWKAEYDGNVQTAPDAYPSVTLRLDCPQWVECVRYMVKHADNGIRPNDTYSLRKWTASGWTEIWRKTAVTDAIEAGSLNIGGLYWLRNLSRGKEELPFIVKESGEVTFPHEWILREVENARM